MPPQRGKVYLVGAGPGDPGLLTVRALRLLRRCDVLVYDALISPQVLGEANSRSIKVYAGKRGAKQAGRKAELQARIHRLLERHATAGKTVVRLKGGDPFLFGRGGEEAEFLAGRGIPFEVVPGVSALASVPAYAGIPVTDRRTNSVLTVITGHSSEDSYQGPGVDWRRLSPRGTLVIFMGLDRLRPIVRRLRLCGWPASMPAAAVSRGTWREQRVVEGTLGDIAAKVVSAAPGFTAPAIVVVGQVVRMRRNIDWFRPGRRP